MNPELMLVEVRISVARVLVQRPMFVKVYVQTVGIFLPVTPQEKCNNCIIPRGFVPHRKIVGCKAVLGKDIPQVCFVDGAMWSFGVKAVARLLLLQHHVMHGITGNNYCVVLPTMFILSAVVMLKGMRVPMCAASGIISLFAFFM
jgi:hypothetical protein